MAIVRSLADYSVSKVALTLWATCTSLLQVVAINPTNLHLYHEVFREVVALVIYDARLLPIPCDLTTMVCHAVHMIAAQIADWRVDLQTFSTPSHQVVTFLRRLPLHLTNITGWFLEDQALTARSICNDARIPPTLRFKIAVQYCFSKTVTRVWRELGDVERRNVVEENFAPAVLVTFWVDWAVKDLITLNYRPTDLKFAEMFELIITAEYETKFKEQTERFFWDHGTSKQRRELVEDLMTNPEKFLRAYDYEETFHPRCLYRQLGSEGLRQLIELHSDSLVWTVGRDGRMETTMANLVPYAVQKLLSFPYTIVVLATDNYRPELLELVWRAGWSDQRKEFLDYSFQVYLVFEALALFGDQPTIQRIRGEADDHQLVNDVWRNILTHEGATVLRRVKGDILDLVGRKICYNEPIKERLMEVMAGSFFSYPYADDLREDEYQIIFTQMRALLGSCTVFLL